MDEAFLNELATILKGQSFKAPKWTKEPPPGAAKVGTVAKPTRAIITLAEKLGELGHKKERQYLISLATDQIGNRATGATLTAIPPTLLIDPKWDVYLYYAR